MEIIRPILIPRMVHFKYKMAFIRHCYASRRLMGRCSARLIHSSRQRKLPANPVSVPSSFNALPSYIDTHCHIDYILSRFKIPLDHWPSFKGTYLPTSYETSNLISCSIRSFETVEKLLEIDPTLYASFGIHPKYAKDLTLEIVERIEKNVQRFGNRVVAIGECGLDYYRGNPDDVKVQKNAFLRQINMAVTLDKPLVLHLRQADADAYEFMKDHIPPNHPVHVHCFTSGPDMARRLLDRWSNLYIGFTGIVTFKSANEVHSSVRYVPVERILLETDGPCTLLQSFGTPFYISRMICLIIDFP